MEIKIKKQKHEWYLKNKDKVIKKAKISRTKKTKEEINKYERERKRKKINKIKVEKYYKKNKDKFMKAYKKSNIKRKEYKKEYFKIYFKFFGKDTMKENKINIELFRKEILEIKKKYNVRLLYFEKL
jgi:hypothetical protein